MKNENELKVRSLRIDESTFEKFRLIANEEFGNQGQCLSALLNLYEIEKNKLIIVDRKLEIESFQMYANKLNELFINSLSLNQDTEERVRESFERSLNSKDSLIEELQAQIKKLKEINKESNEQSSKYALENENLTLKIEELEETTSRLTFENKAILEEKTEINRIIGESLELKNTEVKDLNSRIYDLKEEIKRIENVSLDNSELTIKLKNTGEEIVKLRNLLESQKELMVFDKEKAIFDCEKNFQTLLSEKDILLNNEMKNNNIRIEKIYSNHNSEMEILRQKIEILRNENLELKKIDI